MKQSPAVIMVTCNIPQGVQATAASLVWLRQSLEAASQPLLAQVSRLFSLPLHLRSSMYTGPDPGGRGEEETRPSVSSRDARGI